MWLDPTARFFGTKWYALIVMNIVNSVCQATSMHSVGAAIIS